MTFHSTQRLRGNHYQSVGLKTNLTVSELMTKVPSSFKFYCILTITTKKNGQIAVDSSQSPPAQRRLISLCLFEGIKGKHVESLVSSIDL